MWSFAADLALVWIFLHFYLLYVACGKYYTVSAPKKYVALSGDIETNFKVPADASSLRVQLTDVSDSKERHLVKKEVPKAISFGKIVFPCGIVDRAGKFEFRLITTEGQEKVLAKSEIMEVTWPEIAVHVPLLVETYSSDFIVELLATIKCHPREEEDYKMHLELMYLGPSLPSVSQHTSWYHSYILLNKTLPPVFTHKNVEVSLDCEVFDRAGYHKIRIRTEDNVQIAESEIIEVLWSHRYSINVPQSTLEPCNHGITVVYKYPRCTLDQDRIRVYGKKTARHQDMDYLFERKIKKGKHSITITCELLGEEYTSFCFVYVSKANNGAVFELVRQCVSRNIDPGGSSTEWSQWSEWSPCSSTCASGVRSRYRLCNVADDDGNCQGRPVQTEACSNSDCTEITTYVVEESPLVSTRCWCGCSINVTSEGILSGYVTPCEYPVVWHLRVNPSETITLEFRHLNLALWKRWLVIRDGMLDVGPILSVVKDDHPLPPPLQSLRDSVRIELHASSNISAEKNDVWFKIVFRNAEPSKSLAIVSPSIIPESKLGAVHVVFVVLAVLLGTTTTCLLLYYHFRCFRQSKDGASLRSGSPCSLNHHKHPEEEPCPNTHLLAANTSISEISASPLPPKRRRNLELQQSPEDYLHNCFIFRRASSGSVTPTPESVVQSPFLSKRTLPVAAVSPQPQPMKSALRHPEAKNGASQKHITVMSPIRRRDKPFGKASKPTQRESAAPLTASLSEFSITGSEDGFEYDYYDYGCHDVPGSFFCTDPMLMEWPPFIPIPPQVDDLGFPLQHFMPSSPSESQDIQSTKS
ncbi:uncharacterized protein gogo isoform X1 [Centruroides vittatus]|uniref:uncharacterized protein gogo isoform X1 n=1 Tax=Centruroides vittatus TaxID=120091 RepID=UPI00350EE3F5